MEINIMGEVEEERNEAEEEEKRVGEGVMEVMEEEEGRKRKNKVQQSLSSPHHHFPLPSTSSSPLHPLSFFHLLFLCLWPLSTLWRLFFHTQKLIQKKTKEIVSLKNNCV